MFQTILIAPLYNSFIFLVDSTHGNVGWAIIILTLIIRILFYGAFTASIKTQMGMQEVQGDLAEINKTYKDNPDERAKRTMELFKGKKIRPFAGLLALIVQIPVFLALYFALFREGLPHIATQLLYSFVHAPAVVTSLFIGVPLLVTHNIAISIVVAVTQYFAIHFSLARTAGASKHMTKEQEASQRMQRITMLYTMPLVLGFITYSFPAAVGLYFATGNIVSICQELVIRGQFAAKKQLS